MGVYDLNFLIGKSNIQLKYFIFFLASTLLEKGQDSLHFSGLKTIQGSFSDPLETYFPVGKKRKVSKPPYLLA
ncbi:MAG: hypothetical protein CMB74_02830 [Euryarchaeota archaeon]|nr:hypothetical protein [Euryarchaeota archaeon]